MSEHIRPVLEGDIDYVAIHMREDDIEEVMACGCDPLDSLQRGVHLSTVAYTLVDSQGVPIAIMGVTPGCYPGWGAVWLLGTAGIEANSLAFLRRSRQALKLLYDSSGCDVLYNYTYANNKVHHRWLQWLGFRFIRRVVLPPLHMEFIEFVRLKG